MKRIVLTALLLMLMTAFLFAGMSTSLSIKPYWQSTNAPDSGLYYEDDDNALTWNGSKYVQTSHYVFKDSGDDWHSLTNDWWETRQDYWQRAYAKDSFLDIGFDLDTDSVDMVFRADIRQDVLDNLQEPSEISTNIPMVGTLLDLTFPRLGYIDYTSQDEKIYVSLGRRLIKWGPGTYDMAIADSQPYLDNIWAQFTQPMDNDWKFSFNFVSVYPKLWMDYNDDALNFDQEKTIFAHKWSFYNEAFRLSIAELNVVYNKAATFFDASPFAIWHNNNQDDYSNVMLHLTAEGLVGPARIYGGFTMDDFDLPHEKGDDGLSNKPQAMGFMLGAEYHVFDGKKVESEKFNTQDYTLREETFKKEGGLNVGAEWYYASPFLYNRNDTAGKFTIPFQFISLSGAGYVYDNDAFFLGFKYGPDTEVFRLYGEYSVDRIEAAVSAELLRRGRYNIESKYGDKSAYHQMFDGTNVMKLTGTVTTALLLDGEVSYALQDSFKVVGGFGYQRDFTHDKGALSIKLGCSLNPISTDWKNLF